MQYKNYRSDGTILMLAAPDAIKGGVDGEAAAQSYLGRTSWCLFQVLASVVPRRSSSTMGAAWRSSVVGYLLIWGDATRVAAETSVRGRSGRSDDNTKSKTMIKTNNPPRASAGGLAQRRALTGYVMDDDSIRTAVAAWFADQSAAEATYGHISTWETSGVTDMKVFVLRVIGYSSADATRPRVPSTRTSALGYLRRQDDVVSMFMGASAFNQDLGELGGPASRYVRDVRRRIGL